MRVVVKQTIVLLDECHVDDGFCPTTVLGVEYSMVCGLLLSF
jgi:hypothetical protein